ncbi:MAG: radical SAM protein [Candidatus Coatesbacteria bacterium]|nr:MAG: radical SAM protein [Candidatus Coatesbacteria bacterium]
MSDGYKYIFGPVPSRRLGRSLGVDLVPAKVCTFDCIYCQAGRTTNKTIERTEYVPTADVIAELSDWLPGGAADYVTFSGNGEPTLHSGIGEIIAWLNANSGVPVVVVTNGSLFRLPDVRDELASADLVVPSLDTANPVTFRRLNRPDPSLDIETVIEGLVTFAKEFAGEIWLEHFIVPGINDTPAELKALAEAGARIGPARVQLNTAVRPPAETTVRPMPYAELCAIAEKYFPGAEVIAAYDGESAGRRGAAPDPAATARSLMSRRPITAEDLARTAGIDIKLAEKTLELLVQSGEAAVEERDGGRFYSKL